MKKQLVILLAAAAVALGGCGNGNAADQGRHESGHADMNHSTSGEVPEGMKEASDPAFPVGSRAIIRADHMEGMNGAEATVVGAYDTTVYTVSYTPTTGGERVTGHKWVIHEEVEGAGETPYAPGDEVVLKAGHLEGMAGAKATIDAAERTTVYMVDYVPTTGGEPVKNHMWVTESELEAPQE